MKIDPDITRNIIYNLQFLLNQKTIEGDIVNCYLRLLYCEVKTW